MYCGVPTIIPRLSHRRIVNRASESKVRDRNTLDTFFKQDVAGFDVAMNQSLPMSGGQSCCDLYCNSQDLMNRQRPEIVYPFLQ